MSDTVIRVENLSKLYRIGARRELHRYHTLRDSLARAFTAPFRRLNSSLTSYSSRTDVIWALKDVSFEVKRGEVVGIIGRNGAGKTTLLKVLSRITEPTEGYAEIRGRVGSLLEVGTGFHPELTGRENIFLSGAILGMKKAEIKRKFDEIVAFAEIEKFIDTPIKRYSSGMYVRLAFAVAAHLEPEILLVDEVLAVGDIQFQKKCLGKMGDVAKEGRTVLFISHQMNQIRRLCEKTIWLDFGQLKKMGFTPEAVVAYEAAMSSCERIYKNRSDLPQVKARFLRWEIVEPRSDQHNVLNSLGPVTLKLVVQINFPLRMCRHGINLWDQENRILWGWSEYNLAFDPGVYEFFYRLPSLPLRPGVYTFHTSLFAEEEFIDTWYWVPHLVVATHPVTHLNDYWAGLLNIPCQFDYKKSQR